MKGNKKNDKTKIEWNETAIQAFDQCKLLLKEATILNYYDPTLPLALFVDASNIAAGAVVQQKTTENWKPIGFYSEKFNKAVQNYSTFGRELAAMKMAVKYFRHILEGRQFCIFTDHNPLTHAFRSSTDTRLARETRHLQYISEFTTDVRHIAGKENFVADLFSRIEAIESTIDYEEMATQQADDEDLRKILQQTEPSLKLEKLSIHGSSKTLYCDTSTGKSRPFVPKIMRYKVMQHFHHICHSGIRSTRKIISSRFVWPKMNLDVQQFVKSCENCQLSKVQRHNFAPIAEFSTPSARFEHIHIDIVGPLRVSNGQRYILTIIDRFSRWVEAIPIADQTAETVARTLYNEWVCRYGTLEVISTDQGKNFESLLLTELRKFLGTTRIRTCAYHPSANGLVERFHRTMKASIISRNSKNWTAQLPTVLLGIRTAFRDDFQGSVAEMMFGEPLKIPGEFFQKNNKSADQTEFIQQMRKTFENIRPVTAKHHAKEKPFILKDMSECTHVYVRVDKVKASLEAPYTGPYKVIKKHAKYFDVEIKGKPQRITIDRLKPAFVLHTNLAHFPPDDTFKIMPTKHKTSCMA